MSRMERSEIREGGDKAPLSGTEELEYFFGDMKRWWSVSNSKTIQCWAKIFICTNIVHSV
jgi:hypothetical protein